MKKSIPSPLTSGDLERLINEGIWDSIKYGLSKLGSLEKHGKLRGKEEEVAKRKEMFSNTLERLSSQVVKDLIAGIAKEDAKHQEAGGKGEFPNQKSNQHFMVVAQNIPILYDSLKAGVEKYKPGQEKQPAGSLSPEIANEIVDALRQYVKMLLDQDLADVYKHFTESDDPLVQDAMDLLEETDDLNEIFGLGQKAQDKKWADKEASLAAEEEFDALSPDEQKAAKAKKWGKEEAETIKGLKARLLPIMMNLAGPLGFGAEYLLMSLFGGPKSGEIIETFGQILEETPKGGDPKPALEQVIEPYAEGMFQEIEMSSNPGLATMLKKGAMQVDPNAKWDTVAQNINSMAEASGRTPDEVMEQIGSIIDKHYPAEYGTTVLKGLHAFDEGGGRIAGAFGNSKSLPSQEFRTFMKEWLPQNSPSEDVATGINTALNKVGSMHGGGTGTNLKTLLAVSNAKLVLAKAVSGVAGVIAAPPVATALIGYRVAHIGSQSAAWYAGANTGLALSTSGILSTLGLAGMLAGTSLYLLRKKGLHSSRAQVLNDIWKELKDFPVEDGVLPPGPDPQPTPPEPDPEPDVDKDRLKPSLVLLDSKSVAKGDNYHLFTIAITSKKIGEVRNAEFKEVQNSAILAKLGSDVSAADFKSTAEVQQEAGPEKEAEAAADEDIEDALPPTHNIDEKRTRKRRTGTVDSGEFKYDEGAGQLTQRYVKYNTLIKLWSSHWQKYGRQNNPLYFVFDGTYLTKTKELGISQSVARRLASKLVDELHEKSKTYKYWKLSEAEMRKILGSDMKVRGKKREALTDILREFGVVATEKETQRSINQYERDRRSAARAAQGDTPEEEVAVAAEVIPLPGEKGSPLDIWRSKSEPSDKEDAETPPTKRSRYGTRGKLSTRQGRSAARGGQYKTYKGRSGKSGDFLGQPEASKVNKALEEILRENPHLLRRLKKLLTRRK